MTNKISQGFFSQPTSILSKKQHYQSGEKKLKQNIQPNRKIINELQTQNRISFNTNKKPKLYQQTEDKTTRSISKRIDNKQLNEQMQKLKMENKRLKDKIRQYEKQETNKNNELLQYQLYIKQIKESISLEQAGYKNQLASLRRQISKYITVEKQNQSYLHSINTLKNQKLQLSAEISNYQKILRQTIIFLMSSFNHITMIKDNIAGNTYYLIDKVQKNFVKIFKLMNPFIDQWGIQNQLNTLKQQQYQQQKVNLIQLKQLETVRSNDNPLQDTFQAKQLITAASTVKSLSDQFQQQKYIENTFVTAAQAYENTNQNHLKIQKGGKIKLLKKNAKSNLWIGQYDDKIGYFLANILQ